MLREVIYWVLLIGWAITIVVTTIRDVKRKDDEKSRLELNVESLTLELSLQGLLMHRKNQYYWDEVIEISRCGKYNSHYKVRVPSLNIEVEGEWFEEAIEKVNQAIKEYHENMESKAYERCQCCSSARYGSWLRIKCSKNRFEHGRIPYECELFQGGLPQEEEYANGADKDKCNSTTPAEGQ